NDEGEDDRSVSDVGQEDLIAQLAFRAVISYIAAMFRMRAARRGPVSLTKDRNPMAELTKPRLVGLNHIALEVGDIEEALAFYEPFFTVELRGKSGSMAFIDLGDQFIALQKGRKQPADDGRHFGLVVDDKEAARRVLEAAGVTVLEGRFLDFRDPWGNRVEIV